MKRVFDTSVRRPLIALLLMVSMFVTSGSIASATSVTTTTLATPLTTCGVVASPAVHFVSKGSPCEIRVRVGTNVRIRFRTGLHWSNPVSNSRAVAVIVISRSSIGVNAATLHAATMGRARIVATGTVYCKPGTMCPDLAMLWSLEVIVT